ncbi:MAG TPA: hypothetical protein VD927_04150 [Chryseosolibacter sp.]|nr:hypothetical protein [Chryseosolibacter sp.]
MSLKLFFVVLNFALTQIPGNFWHVLAEVQFIKSKDPQGYEIEKPVFSKHLRSYNGKKVTLKGYLIPLNEINGKGSYVLSSLPFNVCYFCGAAGPETVVELETTEPITFTTKSISIEGILSLNEKDIDHHIYIIKSPRLLP